MSEKTYIKSVNDLHDEKNEFKKNFKEMNSILLKANTAWDEVRAPTDRNWYKFFDEWEEWIEMSENLISRMAVAVDEYY